MDDALLERVRRGTPLYPLQIYRLADTARPADVACHWHHEIEILFVQQGVLHVEAGGRLCAAGAGDVVFLNSETLHRMHTERAPYRYCALVFPPEFLCFQQYDYAQSRYLAPLEKGELRLPLLLPRAAGCREAVWRMLMDMERQDAAQAPAYQLEAKALLLGVLARLAREGLLDSAPGAARADGRNGQVKAVLAYLNEHYAERLTLGDMAREFGLSPKYFCSFFTRAVGKPFVAYLNRLRIEHACALLADTDKPVMEVAFQVGFGHFSYFIKTFRETTGCTPTQYRRAARPGGADGFGAGMGGEPARGAERFGSVPAR